MKPFTILLSCVLCAQLCISPIAFARTMKYTPGTTGDSASIEGDVSVNRIGKLQLPKSLAVIKDRKIVVLAATDSGEISGDVSTQDNKKKLLGGDVFNTHLVGEGKNAKCEGFAFFHEGSDLSQIDGGQDVIQLKDGTTCSGPITSMDNTQTQIETNSGSRTLSTSSIEKIKSNRVFNFSLPLTATESMSATSSFSAEGSAITFTGTQHVVISTAQVKAQPKVAKASASQTSSNSDRKRRLVKRLIIVTVVLCAIATAIAVPVAVCCANHGHGSSPPAPFIAVHPAPSAPVAP